MTEYMIKDALILVLFYSYLFAKGPGGAETTLKLSSVMSDPDALLGPRRSLPEVLASLNEFPRLSTPTGNEPALSILVLGSTLLDSIRRLPVCKIMVGIELSNIFYCTIFVPNSLTK